MSESHISPKELKQAHLAFKKEVGSRILTASRIKEYFKGLDVRSNSEFIDAVANEVYAMLKKCAMRALRNGRKTVRPWDL